MTFRPTDSRYLGFGWLICAAGPVTGKRPSRYAGASVGARCFRMRMHVIADDVLEQGGCGRPERGTAPVAVLGRIGAANPHC